MCRLCVDHMEAAEDVLVEFEGAPSSVESQAKFSVWAYTELFPQNVVNLS